MQGRLRRRILPIRLDFTFDGPHAFLGDVHEFDPYAHAGVAVADLRPRAHLIAGIHEFEADIENRALRKDPSSVDKHAAGTEIGRMGGDGFAMPFVADRKIAEIGKTPGLSRSAPGRHRREFCFAVSFCGHEETFSFSKTASLSC